MKEQLTNEEITQFQHKLDNKFIPHHYAVMFAIDPERKRWSGAVQITGNTAAEQTKLVLHAAPNLHISSIIVTSSFSPASAPLPARLLRREHLDHANSHHHHTTNQSSTLVVVPSSHRRSAKHSLLMIDLETTIEKDREVVVVVTYQSDLAVDTEMEGLYASTSTDPSGKKEVIVSTQFEAEAARKAFPCVDEPRAKAVFEVLLGVPASSGPEFRALSNMPEVEDSHPNWTPQFNTVVTAVADSFFSLSSGQQPHASHRYVRFAPTPPMTTYLLVVVVGRLGMIETEARLSSGSVIQVRAFSELGFEKHVEFALKASAASLVVFTNVFGAPYSLPKLDMVAIPNYLHGAMENWGLVTYHRDSLYLDPHSDSLTEHMHVAEVVWHENAHQWFGNLVTMTDWDDLYLNEGFASFMETYSLDWLFQGKFPTGTNFIKNNGLMALQSDALKHTHPLANAREADGSASEAMFDAISYQKGAALLYMLRSYINALKPSSFETSIRQYIAENKFANADSRALWKTMASVSGRHEVETLMLKWCQQAGFPLLTLALDKSKCSVSVRQQRFELLSKGQPSQQSSSELWTVPLYVNFHTGVGQESTHLVMVDGNDGELTCSMMHGESNTSSASDTTCCFTRPNAFIKANHHQAGFVRVRYDIDLLKRLSDNINTLPLDDVLGFLSDLFALNEMDSSSMHIGNVLGGVWALALHGSGDMITWDYLLSRLSWIDGMLFDAPFFPEWRTFLHKLVTTLLKPLGLDAVNNESHTPHLLREVVVSAAVVWDEPTTIGVLAARFMNAMSGGVTLNSYLKAAIFRAGVIHNCKFQQDDELCQSTVDWLLQRSKLNVPQEHGKCLSAVTRIKSVVVADKLIDYAQSESASNFPVIISGLFSNPLTRHHIWSYIQNSIKKIQEKMPDNLQSIVRVCSHFSTNDEKQQVQSFLEQHAKTVSQRTKDQILETIETRADWVEANKHNLESFLRKFHQTTQ
eukprot:c11541_g1_i1.p1 GENE.c11541_g1_i1~~c11541_g1_i1.p1  ORF type:complete len:1145 (-),score=323.81 c11541_g1_i1:249-3182(-)